MRRKRKTRMKDDERGKRRKMSGKNDDESDIIKEKWEKIGEADGEYKSYESLCVDKTKLNRRNLNIKKKQTKPSFYNLKGISQKICIVETSSYFLSKKKIYEGEIYSIT